jgi:signal transduction histidine kinase
MRAIAILGAIAVVLAAVLGAGCISTSPLPANRTAPTPTANVSQTNSTAALVAFVQDAAAYVSAVGEKAALAEFQRKDGRFTKGDLYIYAYDRNGTLLAHPYQPGQVGTNRTDFTDIRGLPFVRVGNLTAGNGGGFLAYLYPAPANGTLDEAARETYETKIGYVAPIGNGSWIGSGMYFADMTFGGTGPDAVSEMVDLVERCAAYSRSEGKEKAFSAIGNRSGPFVDRDGHYIYGYDYGGTLLAHPHIPEKVGTSLIGRQDRFGMQNIRALCDTARSGGGYIVFVWPNPAHENRDEIKIGYVLPVDETWWVGSGTYLSELTGTDTHLAPDT